jgi:ATP-dependent Lon protease
VGQLVEQHLRLAPIRKPMRCKPRCVIRNLRISPTRSHRNSASQSKTNRDCSRSSRRKARLQRLIECWRPRSRNDSSTARFKRASSVRWRKAQKEYYLNEQIKAIHKELGRKDEKAELEELKKKIEEAA